VVNGASTLQFSKSNFATQSISVVVSDQSDATEQNIVLVPADSTITLTVADNPTANFEDLQAQLYLDTDAGGTRGVGSAETVGADRTVIFTIPPSRPTSDVARTHHYRIVLSGTDFVTKTLDDLDLLPGTPLTPATTIVSHPSAPQTLSVVARAAGGVTATWTAPASDGGDAVDSYRVEWDLGVGTFGNATVITGSLTADITAVDQGDDVSVRVSATNEAGTGPSSAIATAIAPSAPDPVGSVTADATVAARQVDLSWVAPDANGSAINGYDIQYKLDTQGWEDAITTASSPPLTTSASITGLNAGSDYEFRVRAVNGVDAGDYSTGVSATPADIPAPPANFAVASFGDSEVALSWDAANANGSAITRYEYRLDDGNGFGTAISAGTSTTATVTGLTNGTAYDFQIRAVNAIGDSAWSTSITETPRTTPTTPTAVVVTGGAGQISVAWTDPADNGGSPITQYDVRYRIGTGDWVEVIDYTENDPITGLNAATTFEVEARAVNGVGNSAWSTSASGTTDA
jgi:titin